ncbi:NADPH dehydrogenase [Paracholeplasma brassicae]|uniref:NADPH dehydrogenase n=1 Tax=Acholeplasma brassicae TaxID=61635 RepID=U4KRQ3_9MOLU|nr:NADPH dehydrogenase NamA [Paracholeplasma brassicae]CCV65943.1 NADPH dehydrogenase [Paracholeplasma brassicae]
MISLFDPITIKDQTIKNRIVMPPMCMYSAEGGYATDFHVIHYASRAIGGVGLIIVEATAVLPNGRITNQDLGLYEDEHVKSLKWITKQIRQYDSVSCIQLNHAGRKSKADGKLMAPSAIAFGTNDVPVAMSIDDIKEVINAFRSAAHRALEAGFDMIEIHAAHGYLLHEFMSPLANKRTDHYGGILENRSRLLREVVEAVRDVFPMDKPVSLRISAEDYVKEGLHPTDWVEAIKLIPHGYVDLIHVSSGGIVLVDIDAYPGYQLSFAKKIKRETRIPTIAGGLIEDPFMASGVLQENEADLIYFGRLSLREPYFPLRFAKQLRIDLPWPKQYERSKK